MDNSLTNSKDSKNRSKLFFLKKYLFLAISLFFIFILFFGGFSFFNFIKDSSLLQEETCGDGTSYNNCSNTKPYFCLDGKLIDLASVCECPENFFKENNFCVSPYQTEPKEISLNYIVRGKTYFTDFEVYGGFKEYISNIPRSINHLDSDNLSRADFKIKVVNEEEQRKMLLPLVIKIQNMTSIKEDQARIAISIVQNIPFGASNKTSSFGGYEINYSRYPYGVIYDMEGICGEKTDLLALLLKEMGYGVAFFYYPSYNHEALGIKCSIKESLLKSEYCFVETTGPSIITDDKIYYVNIGKLSLEPEFYLISDGKSIGNNLYEYSDADKLVKIRNSIEKYGMLGSLSKRTLEKLNEKYGLAEDYYGG